MAAGPVAQMAKRVRFTRMSFSEAAVCPETVPPEHSWCPALQSANMEEIGGSRRGADLQREKEQAGCGRRCVSSRPVYLQLQRSLLAPRTCWQPTAEEAGVVSQADQPEMGGYCPSCCRSWKVEYTASRMDCDTVPDRSSQGPFWESSEDSSSPQLRGRSAQVRLACSGAMLGWSVSWQRRQAVQAMHDRTYKGGRSPCLAP